MRIHQAALPVLKLAKASVTGIGILEPVISGILELATVVDTMHSNKEDLSQLEQRLDNFIAIDTSDCGDNLRDRLTMLVLNLTAVSVECKSLTGKHRFERFFMSREHKDRINGIRNAIASHIQEFTVRINRRRVSFSDIFFCSSTVIFPFRNWSQTWHLIYSQSKSFSALNGCQRVLTPKARPICAWKALG
ncbi:hypothetical protein C8R45DRAFT_1029882 [Mycena sanguinolenta]|nr:hypothetical protein C8R45DRAFT_1029882 [Mycena sanguinolenta]